MTFPKKILLHLFALLVVSNVSLSGDIRGYVSAGLKIGYAFGASGGVVVGGEVSFNRFDLAEGHSIGVCFAFDQCRSVTKYHCGAEVSFATAGIEYGPTVIVEEHGTSNSASLTAFLGFLAIPYYSVTFNNDRPAIHEAGTYLKFPAQLYGRREYGE